MRLRDPKLLVGYMELNDFSQARLARFAGCSRQFVHMLVSGQRTTCTVEVGRRIEEALRVVPTTLFDPFVSPVSTQPVAQKAAS